MVITAVEPVDIRHTCLSAVICPCGWPVDERRTTRGGSVGSAPRRWAPHGFPQLSTTSVHNLSDPPNPSLVATPPPLVESCPWFRWSRSALSSRWSSSARRGTSRARVETSTKSPGTLTGSRHGRSFLAAYSISGWGHESSRPTRSAGVEFRWSSSALWSCWSSSARRGTSRARVETSTKSPRTLTGSRHGRSFLVGYSISGRRVPPVAYSISGNRVPSAGRDLRRPPERAQDWRMRLVSSVTWV